MPDWQQLFVPQVPILATVVRGSAVYLSLYAMLRITFKREAGSTGMTDLLVLVLLADAAQNAMAGSYTSITDGLLLVAVIVAWAFLLDAASFKWRAVERIVKPGPLPLIKDGELQHRALRRELITRQELMAELREQGVQSVAEVRRATMEPDGQISLLLREGRASGPKESATF